ncbi:MAG TPA: hypothetical protein ENI67_04725 [Gammaproteobacteria bacterium]|nr:hypothetical protein [Gammaproteobacteria bacterium]
MTRLDDILERSRDSLADPNKERWTDARLLRLADEAQKIICIKAKLLRTKTIIALVSNQAEYQLPANFLALSRVLDSVGDKLPFVSHEGADRDYGTSWETQIGSTIKAVIYDKLDFMRFKVYPIPSIASTATLDTLATLSSPYGVLVDGSDTAGAAILIDYYGIVSNVVRTDGPVVFTSLYGVTTGLTRSTYSDMTVYYYRRPAAIIDTSTNLEIGELFDRAMKFYIAGMALLDDRDIQNVTLGKKKLDFFYSEVAEAIKDSEQDFTGSHTQYDAPYTGGF